MASLVRVLRERLLPAALTAAGVTLIAAGILSYTGSDVAAAVDPPTSEEPIIVAADPTATPALPSVAGTASPSASPSAAPAATPTPLGGPNPDRVATRVVVEPLGIDLPVVKPRGDSSTYPQCNVALYIQELAQPGNGGATYLYAHARDGMFGPIYVRAILRTHGGPRSMVGMHVEVYTSDDLVFEYAVVEVRLHQLNLDAAFGATSEELWLQTSEGPKGTPGKTQLRATPLGAQSASHAAAHPTARPVSCG